MHVILMSGISGSGKTTYVKKNYPNAFVCSADSFFEKNGEYHFDPSKLVQAHSACLLSFVEELQACEEDSIIVVDNTNTTALELAPYVALAQAYECKITLVTMRCDPETAHRRNKHNVPKEAILSMYNRLQGRELPRYWNIEIINAYE